MANTRPHTDSSHYRNENRLAVWVILEIFWTISLKAHDWSSWILAECNLSWKTVKYRILSEDCMIKNIKRWLTHPQICWQEFVKYTCLTQKIHLICFPRICFRGLICNVIEDVCYFWGVHIRLSTHSKIT